MAGCTAQSCKTTDHSWLLSIYETYPSLSPQLEIWGDITGIEGQSGKEMCQGDKPDTAKLVTPSYIGMNVCGSTRNSGLSIIIMKLSATYTNNTTQSEYTEA